LTSFGFEKIFQRKRTETALFSGIDSVLKNQQLQMEGKDLTEYSKNICIRRPSLVCIV